MTIKQPFAPKQGSNQTLSATNVSASTGIEKHNKQVRIANKGTIDVFVRFYRGADANPPAATSADYCVIAGTVSIVTKSEAHDTMAYLADGAGPAVLRVCTGEGF
jgi:hypothetical protein